ncbi:MAG: FadR family transcriptional regulator [Candidatus Marsarchaeota archaeon]|nr:FadR family transcriptional regulator [Candidatus Marsarchaeota archaeon]
MSKVTRTYLYQSAADRIQECIATNQLQPGDRLPSTESLCGSLGVGRTSLREALRLLQTSGIVEIHSGLGVFVANFSLAPLIEETTHYLIATPHSVEISELLEIRTTLELEATKLAAGRIEEPDLRTLHDILERMESKINNGMQPRTEDIAFHETVYSASRNGILKRLASSVTHLLFEIQDVSSLAVLDAQWLRESFAALRKVYEAFGNRDGETAVQAMKDHIERVTMLFERSNVQNQAQAANNWRRQHQST